MPSAFPSRISSRFAGISSAPYMSTGSRNPLFSMASQQNSADSAAKLMATLMSDRSWITVLHSLRALASSDFESLTLTISYRPGCRANTSSTCLICSCAMAKLDARDLDGRCAALYLGPLFPRYAQQQFCLFFKIFSHITDPPGIRHIAVHQKDRDAELPRKIDQFIGYDALGNDGIRILQKTCPHHIFHGFGIDDVRADPVMTDP